MLAGHGDLDKIHSLLAAQPELLNVAHAWSEQDHETALGAAAHVGHAPIARFLLAQGAPLDICTAAMLGQTDAVNEFLRFDSGLVRAKGAHGIPLLAHAALSGDADLVRALVDRGATEGTSMALSLAVSRRHAAVARWLLEHVTPDLTWKNFQGKTALAIAMERGDDETVSLLRAYGATS